MTSSKIVVVSVSIFEIILPVLIWHQDLSATILVVPVAFLAATIFSYLYGIDCGCFGSLLFLNQLSFGAHLVLLLGMLLGFYYLTVSLKHEEVSKNGHESSLIPKNKTRQWPGLIAVVLMFSSFLTLPISLTQNRISPFISSHIVDRVVAETTTETHGTVIIDARPEFQYQFGHIPTAINIPYDRESLIELVDKNSLKSKSLIVYCSSSHCNAAELLAQKLRDLGCQKVRIYSGGWEDWIRNYPNHSSKNK